MRLSELDVVSLEEFPCALWSGPVSRQKTPVGLWQKLLWPKRDPGDERMEQEV